MSKKLTDFCLGHTFPWIQAAINYNNPVKLLPEHDKMQKKDVVENAMIELTAMLKKAFEQNYPITEEGVRDFLLIQGDKDPKFEFFKLIWPLYYEVWKVDRIKANQIIKNMLNIESFTLLLYIKMI
jgi:hypothetical protein